MDPVELAQREAVVAEALTWDRTPWRHMEERKGAGVDCAQLVRRVFIDAGIVDHVPDGRPYPSQWAHHRGEERILNMVRTFAVEVESPRVADVVLWQFGRCYSHCGIVIDEERVIHAWADNGLVIPEPMRAGHLSMRGMNDPRPVRFFDVWAGRRRLVDQPVPP